MDRRTLLDSAATSVNEFGTDLYTALAARAASTPNLVVSPASVAIALAMMLAGAAGDTGAQLAAALHSGDATALAASMNALTTGFDSHTQTVEVPGGDSADVVLAIATSLWLQAGFCVEVAFLDVLATQYGAGLRSVDYSTDPEAAGLAINAWVDEATHGRIPELLGQGAVTTDTQLILVNAVYMKAPWLHMFSDDATAPAAFTTNDGTSVQAPTMHVVDQFDYAAGEGYQAVVLPYLGDGLSMVIVLHDAGQPPYAAAAAVATLGDATSARVAVSLPKFDIETSVALTDVLIALGVTDAFDPVTANLRGIADTTPPLFVNTVIHQANITVDEQGTEAAAATAVLLAGGAAAPPAEPIDFTVDRPFVFAVRDDTSGAILFLGHIGDPTLTRS